MYIYIYHSMQLLLFDARLQFTRLKQVSNTSKQATVPPPNWENRARPGDFVRGLARDS